MFLLINFFSGVDMYILLGLLGVVIIVLVLSRMKILPKNSFIFAIAGLLGVVGVSAFRHRRTKSLLEDLKREEDILKKKETELKKQKERYDASEEKLREVSAELENKRAAYEKKVAKIKAKGRKERKRIDELSGDELHEEFLSAIEDL